MLICFSSLTNFHTFLPLYFRVCRTKKGVSKLASFISVLKHPTIRAENSVFHKSSSASRDALNYRKTKKKRGKKPSRVVLRPCPWGIVNRVCYHPKSRQKKTLGKTQHSEHFCILFCNCDCISIFFSLRSWQKKMKHRFAISDNDECISLLFGWFTQGPEKE